MTPAAVDRKLVAVVYMGLEFLAKARLRLVAGETPDQNPASQAITA